MRAVDTNILVRFFERDDARLTVLADGLLQGPDEFFVSLIVLCEFAWVLRSNYRRRPEEVAKAIRSMVDVEKLMMDRDAVMSGLALLEAGGDFSDGIVLHEARRAGARDVVTFDHEFARLGAPAVIRLS